MSRELKVADRDTVESMDDKELMADGADESRKMCDSFCCRHNHTGTQKLLTNCKPANLHILLLSFFHLQLTSFSIHNHLLCATQVAKNN